ncbi:MAG TPA: SulP family inorganic anion transporter [Sphaerochaeta sp.]|nr:SulP family inorganic anion transporter [Sphaerochaeta sp.]
MQIEKPKSASFLSDLQREFAGYNRATFSKDLMAGLTVAAVALPLALAFAVSSGQTAASGLITAILSGLIIAALGGASYQISGPTGTMAMILITVSAQWGIEGVLFVTFLSGIVRLLAGLFRVGSLVSYIPAPVVTGFTSGIAIIIAFGQIDPFFGVTSTGTQIPEMIASYFRDGFAVQLPALAFGLFVVLFMIFWPKKLNAKIHASLLSLIIALVLQMIFNLPVAEVGEIPRTLVAADRLRLFSIPWQHTFALLSPAVSIAALGMVESLLCGTYAAKMKDEKFNATRELYAQGVGNLIVPFFGGIPATAAIARTSVAIRAGQQTRMTSIIHALALMLSMFLLGPFLSRIPLAALAGVLIVTAWRMNDWVSIKTIFQKRIKTSMAQFLITMGATVFFDLTVAIIAGIVFSMIMYVIKSHRIGLEVASLEANERQTQVITVDGSLFFGSLTHLRNAAEQLIEQGAEKIIFNLGGVSQIDHSAVIELSEIAELCSEQGVAFSLTDIQEPVVALMERLSFFEEAPELLVHPSVEEALK